MARVTIAFGVILILLGVGAYGLALGGVIGDKPSVTALIPAFVGIAFLVLGFVGIRKPSANKHVMHGAVLLGLLGFFGTIPGAIKLIRNAAGALPADAPVHVFRWSIQASMCVLMLVFVVLCVRSFIAARRARTAAAT